MKNWGCDKCEGLGYRTQPQLAHKRSVHILEACECVEALCSSCPGDKTPPYVYLDEKTRQIRACECKPPRDSLGRVRELFRQSNIPLKYRYHRLKEFILQPQYPNGSRSPEMEAAKKQAAFALTGAFDKARHFIEAQKKLHTTQQNVSAADLRGLLLIGPPGTGKSLLAAMILNELILTAQMQCRYIKISRDFFQSLRSTFNADSGSYGKTETVFNDIARQDVLVIDDFGIQSDSEWEQRMLYDLIDARYESELPTIITSNVDLDVVKNLFKGRISSRFAEMLHEVSFLQVRDFRQEIHFNA